MTNAPPAAWERQPYESDAPWEAFRSYRDQRPPRRVLAVQVACRPLDPITAAEWSARYFWAERAAEYDRRLDGIVTSERERVLTQAASEIAAEHLGMLQNAREICDRELSKLLAHVREQSPEVMKPRDLIALYECVAKHDRLFRGESTERREIDFSGLSDDQLTAIEDMLGGRDASSLPRRGVDPGYDPRH